MNQVIFLYGLPASGKLTMATRLVAEDAKNGVYHTKLADNHYFHDFVRPFIGSHGGVDEYWNSVGLIQKEFMKILGNFYPKDKPVRYIFTGVIVSDSDSFLIDSLQNLAIKIGGEFIPIGLVPKLDVMKSRCSAESRKERGKLHSAEKYTTIFGTDNNRKPLEFSHPNQLLINNSNMTEDETFQTIRQHLASKQDLNALEQSQARLSRPTGERQ